jgi:hypothetical protein
MCCASRVPTRPNARISEIASIPRMTRRNGGGLRSHCWRIPLAAAAHVSVIHAAESIVTITAARRAADSGAPDRRHAMSVAHTSVAASAIGIKTNAAITGSLSR